MSAEDVVRRYHNMVMVQKYHLPFTFNELVLIHHGLKKIEEILSRDEEEVQIEDLLKAARYETANKFKTYQLTKLTRLIETLEDTLLEIEEPIKELMEQIPDIMHKEEEISTVVKSFVSKFTKN